MDVAFGSPLSFTPKLSRKSAICLAPCNRRLTPRGKPRHDAKLIEFKWRQLIRISLTASNDTDEPHRFKWLNERVSNGKGTECVKFERKIAANCDYWYDNSALTSAVIRLLFRQLPLLHYPVAPVHWPRPNRFRSDCEPILMQSIPDPNCFWMEWMMRWNQKKISNPSLTQYLVSPNSLIRTDAVDPKLAIVWVCHVSIVHSPSHPAALILYSFSVCVAGIRRSWDGIRLAVTQPTILPVRENQVNPSANTENSKDDVWECSKAINIGS